MAPSFQQPAKVNLGAIKPKVQFKLLASQPPALSTPSAVASQPLALSTSSALVSLDVNSAFAAIEADLDAVVYLETRDVYPTRPFHINPGEILLKDKHAWLINFHIDHYLELVNKKFAARIRSPGF